MRNEDQRHCRIDILVNAVAVAVRGSYASGGGADPAAWLHSMAQK
jgi:hypothetical protein